MDMTRTSGPVTSGPTAEERIWGECERVEREFTPECSTSITLSGQRQLSPIFAGRISTYFKGLGTDQANSTPSAIYRVPH